MPLDRTSEVLDLTELTQLWVGVLIADQGGFVVRLGGFEKAQVQRAASCLLELAEGDRVLLHGRAPNIYAIAVLSRSRDTLSVLTPARGKALKIQASDIAIDATNSVTLRAPKANMSFTEATLNSHSWRFLGEAITIIGGVLRTIARSIENTADRMTASLGSRTTLIHDVDILRSNTTMTSVEGLSATRTGSMAITAKHDVRVDAERISLG